MKNRLFKFFLFLLAILVVFSLVGQPTKEKPKVTPTGVYGSEASTSIKEGISTDNIEGVAVELTGGIAVEHDKEEKPRIKLKIKIMEVSASSSRMLSNPTTETKNGEKAIIVQGERFPWGPSQTGGSVPVQQNEFRENSLRLEITPTIVQGKGIELKIHIANIRFDQERGTEKRSQSTKTELVKNLETVAVVVLENAKSDTRIVAQITPFIVATGVKGDLSEGDAGGVDRGVRDDVAENKSVNGSLVTEDFFPDKTEIILIGLELIEVTASKTKEYGKLKMMVEPGNKMSFLQGKKVPIRNAAKKKEMKEESFGLEILPTIDAEKGIVLNLQINSCQIDVKTGQEIRAKNNKIVTVRNMETATIELLQNARMNSRIIAGVTPLIQMVPAARAISAKTKVHLNDAMIVFNERVVYRDKSFHFQPDEVLTFSIPDKGLYLLAFKEINGADSNGVANGNKIKFTIGDDNFLIYCREPILPAGKWRVWVRYQANLKGELLGCRVASLADSLKRFQ